MVRPGVVVSHRFGGMLAEEQRSRMAYPGHDAPWVAGEDFHVFGRDGVGHVYAGLEARHKNNGAPVTQRGGSYFRAGKIRKTARERGEHPVGQMSAVRHADGRGQL